LLARGGVPDPHRPVERGGREPLAVGAERHLGQLVQVALQGERLLARGGDQRRSLLRRGGGGGNAPEGGGHDNGRAAAKGSEGRVSGHGCVSMGASRRRRRPHGASGMGLGFRDTEALQGEERYGVIPFTIAVCRPTANSPTVSAAIGTP